MPIVHEIHKPHGGIGGEPASGKFKDIRLNCFPHAKISGRPRITECRGPGSNRHGSCEPRDFKSLASANSATPAERQN